MPTLYESMVNDPIGFLSSDAPNMTGGVPIAPGVTGQFRARFAPNFKVRYRTGSKLLGLGNAKANGRAWELRCHKPGDLTMPDEELFDAVWSGYTGGLATHCELPTQGGPDLMLTPRVDGCTLTLGSTQGGGARFGHYNLVDGDRTIDAAGMVAAAEQNYAGQEPTVFSKEYYYAKAKQVTPGHGLRTFVNAIGVRKNGVWRFYVQYLESKGDGYQIRGVEELARGARYIAAAMG